MSVFQILLGYPEIEAGFVAKSDSVVVARINLAEQLPARYLLAVLINFWVAICRRSSAVDAMMNQFAHQFHTVLDVIGVPQQFVYRFAAGHLIQQI